MTEATSDLRLGVDLGGTKIEAAIVDPAGDVLARARVATPTAYSAILEEVTALCDTVERGADLVAGGLPLGIGTPGSPSPADGRMRNCNSTVLNGRLLSDDLARTSGRAVRMANDADCFALSESRDGAARGAGTAFGVILGTGVGGGITVNGELLRGANGISGEWGHNRLPLERCKSLPPALRGMPRPCYCGASDCVETWLSGAGLALTHESLHGTALDADALHRGMPDDEMRASLDLYCDIAAAALATVINVLDPEVVVLGGGLSNIGALYDRLPASLAQQVFSDSFTTPIRPAQHGDSGGVRGAAWLW